MRVEVLTAEKIETALKELPDQAEVIRLVFREKGIKGIKSNECHCPIAEYLRRKFPEEFKAIQRNFDQVYRRTGQDIDLSVDFDRVHFYDLDDPEDFWKGVETPLPVEHFIRRFDEGAYPELEADVVF